MVAEGCIVRIMAFDNFLISWIVSKTLSLFSSFPTGLASDEGKDRSETRLVAKNLKRKSAPTPQSIASSSFCYAFRPWISRTFSAFDLVDDIELLAGSSSEKVREKAKAKFTANHSRFFMTTHTTANSRKYVVVRKLVMDWRNFVQSVNHLDKY